MKKVLTTLTVAIMLTVMAVSPLAAQGAVAVIDQANSNFTPTLRQNVRFFSPYGQEFTPSLAGLDVVELWFQDFGPGPITLPSGYPIQLRVNIREATITGEIVGTSDVAEMPQGFDGPVAFRFPSLVTLRPGDLYVIEVVLVSGADVGAGSSGGPNSTYPYGNQILLGMPQSNNDLWFVEGLASSTPLTRGYCRNDLWQHLSRADGSAFKNQGDCIQFVNSGK